MTTDHDHTSRRIVTQYRRADGSLIEQFTDTVEPGDTANIPAVAEADADLEAAVRRFDARLEALRGRIPDGEWHRLEEVANEREVLTRWAIGARLAVATAGVLSLAGRPVIILPPSGDDVWPEARMGLLRQPTPAQPQRYASLPRLTAAVVLTFMAGVGTCMVAAGALGAAAASLGGIIP
jgi:hypothetical protein